nr:hypothetical protein [Allomuricauda sp.]
MKKLLIICFLLVSATMVGQVEKLKGIILDTLTTTELDALPALVKVKGSLYFDRTKGNHVTWDGTAWLNIGGSAASADWSTITGKPANLDEDSTDELLLDGSTAMTGSVDVGNNNIINVNRIAFPRTTPATELNWLFLSEGPSDNFFSIQEGTGAYANALRLHLENDLWRFGQLSGVGTRMVVADDNGELSSQAIPSGGGTDGLGPDGDKGDITVGGSGTTLDIDADAVSTNEIASNTILETDLNVTNSPSDNQILSYDQASLGFTWVDAPSGGGLTAPVDATNIANGSVTNVVFERIANLASDAQQQIDAKVSITNGAFTADVNMNNNKITQLADPTDPQDAATRAFVLANSSNITELTQAAFDALTTAEKLALGLYIIIPNAPSGYTVTIDQDPIDSGNQAAVSFTWAGAEVGAFYDYTFTSDGGGTPVSGFGTIATATDQINGIDLSGLTDGTVTLTAYISNAGGQGSNALDTSTKGSASVDLFPTGNGASAGAGEADSTSGWTSSGGPAPVTSVANTDGGGGGSFAINCGCTSSGFRTGSINLTGLTIGSNYTATIRTRRTDGTGQIFAWQSVTNQSYNVDYDSNGTNWFVGTVTFEATATSVEARVYACDNDGSASGTIEISEITLTEN